MSHCSPLLQLEIIVDEDPVPEGFQRMDLDLNLDSADKSVYLCIKRGTAIKDIRVCLSTSACALR